MTYPVLQLEPTKDGLSRQFKATGTLTETEGGAPRIRKTVIGATGLYQLNFVCTALQYFYFTSFYEEELQEGNLPFEVNLLSDGLGKVPHVGIIVPGSLSNPRIAGNTYFFSFTFDGARKEKLSKEFKASLVAIIPQFQADDLEGICDIMLSVENAVNVIAPTI